MESTCQSSRENQGKIILWLLNIENFPNNDEQEGGIGRVTYKDWYFWTLVLEKILESPLGLHGDQTSQSSRKSVLNFCWKDWCWSWNSNTLATWWEELTHWKRPWCWEKLKAGGEGDNRGWDGWMASPTWWTWVWASSGCWWFTGKPGVLQSMGSQRIGHDWVTELNLSR